MASGAFLCFRDERFDQDVKVACALNDAGRTALEDAPEKRRIAFGESYRLQQMPTPSQVSHNRSTITHFPHAAPPLGAKPKKFHLADDARLLDEDWV